MQVLSDVLVVLMAAFGTCVFGYLLLEGLKTGECHMKGQRVTRAGEPALYWAIIVMLLAWVVVLPWVGIDLVQQYFF